jgi:hypothetical protein
VSMPILILAMTESVCILEEDNNNRSEEEEEEEAKVPISIIVPIESVIRSKKRQRSYSGNSNSSSSSDSQTAIDFLTPQLPFRYQISRKEVLIWAINKMEANEVFQELPKDIQKTSSGIL